MKHELRIMVLTALFMILASLFVIHPVYAACDATELAKPVAERSADCPAGLEQIELIFSNVVSVVVGLGFIALLVVVIMAGFKYLRSGGEPKALQSAHQTFTWAILGILFMIIAWLTLVLVENFTGIKVTVFDIKSLCGIDVGGVLTDICKKP